MLCCYACSISQYYFYDGKHLEPEWRWETGISIGWMNCLTDLGGRKGNGKKFIKDVNWRNGEACAGLFISTTHRDVVGIRMEWTIGEVRAFDSILKNEESTASLRYERNLQFRSSINELCVLAEFFPLSISAPSLNSFSPYFIFGIGYFHFQPQAYYDGKWINLEPLHTEGQGFIECPEAKQYKLQQFIFPIGCGLKYEISALMNAKLELSYRILMTDYLDDVSTKYIDPSLFNRHFPPATAELARKLADRTVELDPSHQTQPNEIRGNPKNKDAYFSIELKCGFVLNRKRY